ncbi:hypothetical protein DPMN_127159 [Dreissena polymorpha]|uniref:Uncharacterized protein n=1 Tax=Dreissena polymorpha TaxID=45954 RepID=A0A9D4H0T0_DREPO|nr:hypothetical protein DPMN_127159 [Dreissena polymorpha]
MRYCVYVVGRFPVCKTLLQMVSKALVIPYCLVCTSSPGILSTHDDVLFFSDMIAASISSRRRVRASLLVAGYLFFWVTSGSIAVPPPETRYAVRKWMC